MVQAAEAKNIHLESTWRSDVNAAGLHHGEEEIQKQRQGFTCFSWRRCGLRPQSGRHEGEADVEETETTSPLTKMESGSTQGHRKREAEQGCYNKTAGEW